MAKADADFISSEEDVPPPSDIRDRWTELDLCIENTRCLVEVARDALEEAGNRMAPQKLLQVMTLLYVAAEQAQTAGRRSNALFSEVVTA